MAVTPFTRSLINRSLAEAKEACARFGIALAPWAFWTPADPRAGGGVRRRPRAIHVAAPGGRYMLSSSNSIHASVRPGSFRAAPVANRRYGVYA